MKQPRVGDKVKWWGTTSYTELSHRKRATLLGTVVMSHRFDGTIDTKRGRILVAWIECTPQ